MNGLVELLGLFMHDVGEFDPSEAFLNKGDDWDLASIAMEISQSFDALLPNHPVWPGSARATNADAVAAARYILVNLPLRYFED